MTIQEILDGLSIGNGSLVNQENIGILNSRALEIFSQETLTQKEINDLRDILLCCNILYNRSDMQIPAIDDGFYDLLLEKYKEYDKNFMVGSAVVDFKNSIETNILGSIQEAVCPIIFNKPIERNEIRQDIFDQIMRKGQPILNAHDFAINPISFNNENIEKRTHNTEHNHPSLVGTLDKCKFIFIQDAINAGADKDPTVKILERDFFMDHIMKGIYEPNKVIQVVAELKYDGISVEADCGLEVYSARTRGDTGIGVAADITPILQGYTFKHAKCMIGEKPIGVKFEAIMTKSNLETFNKLREKNYKNCRTAIVGLFGASDAYKYRDLITLIPLALDRDDIPAISNRMEEIEFLNRVFRSNGEPLRYCYFEGTVQEILYYIKCFWDEAMIARDYLNFMFDGIVISYLDEEIRQKLGRSNFVNKYSMAVKFDPLTRQTIFRGYTYEVGQHGNITPMIHYDPVEFIGTIHTKSTGSSYQRFMELGLKYGDYINVTYTNDVMPYVSKCDCEANRRNTNPIVPFISDCPICGSRLSISDSGKMAYCLNTDCPGRSVQRMANMLDKMNCIGFSDATIKSLNVSSLKELFSLDYDYIKQRIGEANGYKLYQFIESLNSGKTPIKDYIIMGSLGFTSMAHKKWQSILSKITLSELYDVYKASPNTERFLSSIFSIPFLSIGDVTATTLAKEFAFFEEDIRYILNHFNLIESFGYSNEGKLQIRFTGVRNKQLSELLCNAGYDANDESSAGKKTDILLVPYVGFQSTKISKVSSECKIVAISDFIENMEKYIGEKLM